MLLFESEASRVKLVDAVEIKLMSSSILDLRKASFAQNFKERKRVGNKVRIREFITFFTVLKFDLSMCTIAST